MLGRRHRRACLTVCADGPSRILALVAAPLLVGACVSGLDRSPTPLAPSSAPGVLGLDWTRSAPVERPAEAFDVESNRPFSTGLGNSGHPLHFPGQAIMADVVAANGGYVAIGYVYPGWHPDAWTSPDAEQWTLRPMESTPFTFPVSLVAGPGGGLVAVGRSGNAARTWTSSDGVIWQLHDVPRSGVASLPERMTTVVAGPDGYLAGGSAGPENDGRTARFWTSPDGSSWQPVPDDPAAFANAEVRTIVRTAAGYVALGWVGPARAVTGSVAWISADGRAWSRVDDPALAGGRAVAVIEAPFGGLIAVGADLGDDAALVWSSADGRRWSLAPSEPSRKHEYKTRMTDVARVGDALVAVGNYQGFQYGTATSWVSTDGLHWNEARSAPVQEQGEMYAVIPGGPGLIAVGDFGAPDDYIPTVWLSPPR